jgi:virginiamycin B lyase
MTKLSALLAIAVGLGLTGSAEGVQITQFPIPSSSTPAGNGPWGIAAGRDGALWFTEANVSRIGRMTTSGAVTEFPLPAGTYLREITAGPDGALWFTDGNRIGRITTAGVITEFPVGNASAEMLDITTGPDGNIWYTYVLLFGLSAPTGKIGRMTPSGTVTEFDVPMPARVATAIAPGPDGQIWFAGYSLSSPGALAGVIGSLTTNGEGLGYPLLAGIPHDITSGPDGNIWFTVEFPMSVVSSAAPLGAIGRIHPDLSEIAEFPLPSRPGAPAKIAAGPDGNLWFVEGASGYGRVGRITPAGEITELVPSGSPGGGLGIAAGPDGSIWFTVLPGQIDRISDLAAICTPSPNTLCLGGGRFGVSAGWTKTDQTMGAATAVPLGATATAGYLWFFSPETPEVTVKVIDGCAFNGAVWFFAGGLTDVGVRVSITDFSTPSKTYSSPPGTPFAPIQDTHAFLCISTPFPVPPLRPPS